MVATARPLRTAEQYCDMIGVDAMVVSNGARIICGNQRTEYGICQTSAEHLLSALNRHPALRITLETGDCAYSNLPIADYETILSDNLVGMIISSFIHIVANGIILLFFYSYKFINTYSFAYKSFFIFGCYIIAYIFAV